MSKRTVRHSFERAAGSYDAAASLQRQVSGLLLGKLSMRTPAAVLDAGCGTGHGLRLLSERWPDVRMVAADFAPAMLASTQAGRVCADIEALPFPPASFDLYWSNLAFQWCDAARAAREAARVLAPGGMLAVSSLAPGTLAELDAAFAGIDRHRHVLEFEPAQALADACIAAGLKDVALETRTLRRHHRDLRALLAELKSLGANQVGGGRRPGLLGRRGWEAVEARYESMREAAGLPVTWEVVLCTGIS